jgi:hypothetical protein
VCRLKSDVCLYLDGIRVVGWMVVHTDLSARGSRFGEFRFAPLRPFQPPNISLHPPMYLTYLTSCE